MSARSFMSAGMLAVLALPLSPATAHAQDFDDLVRQAAERNAIPAMWVRAVLQAESAGDPDAVSGAGAMGLMQLMPGTWKDVRRRLNLRDDPFDPHDNIAAGAAYLRWLHDRYGDAGFLAAYNAGPDRYDDHLASGRPLPAETVSYVAHVRTLIENPIVSSAGVLSKIVADWRAGSLFIVSGKMIVEAVRPTPISVDKNAVSLHPFPADFFVSRSAPEQDGDVRAEVVKP